MTFTGIFLVKKAWSVLNLNVNFKRYNLKSLNWFFLNVRSF